MERQQRSEPGPHYPHHEPDSPPHFHQIGFQVCELVLRRERRMGVVFQGILPAPSRITQVYQEKQWLRNLSAGSEPTSAVGHARLSAYNSSGPP